jgi:radical SAM superfamily enzyme YgiQ (UPF0313 family)
MRQNEENPTYQVMLCDLTHVNAGQVSSNVFPLGIGLIGSFLEKSDIGESFNVELFKYPEDLNAKLEDGPSPAVVAFANYSWNLEISACFAKRIRELYPSTVIIFGGPNYGLSDEEINEFWSNHSNYIDFNVILEGELAFYTLLKSLLVNGFDIDKVKLLHNELVNLHYIHTNGKIIKTNVAERVDIDNLPSPYLDTDLLDKFFDGKLIPLTHSTRGCPFKCTFCSEGAAYYNKVKQRQNRIKEEYRYIALKSVEVGIYDLMLSDANYGMFKDDAYRAEQLAMVQSELGYPKNVFVSTGKNQKERVLGVVKKL